MIIDSQVHIWRAATPERPWFSEKSTMPDPFGYDDLRKIMREAGVDRAVLVPPAWEGGVSDFALEGAARHPNRFIVMGRVDVENPDNLALLPRWKESQGMVGIRLAFQKA